MNKKSEYVTKRHFYSDFEKNERRLRKINRNRISQTYSLRELALDEVANYFDKQIIPGNKRIEFRWLLKLQDHWPQVCGNLLANHLRLHSIQKEKLVIETSSGLFLEQARLLEKQFLTRIKQIVPEVNLKNFEFKVGDFEVLDLPLESTEYDQRKARRALQLLNNA